MNIALLVIGTELLTGKVRDTNGAHAASALALAGHTLVELRVIHDVEEAIVAALHELRPRVDFVITAGGVGPTHDDITLAALARALGRELVPDDGLLRLVHAAFGHEPAEARVWRRMALVPSGATLLWDATLRWPVVQVDGVAALPGVPKLFERQLRVVLASLGSASPLTLVVLYLSRDEGRLAELLAEAVTRFGDVQIGSYPIFGVARFQTRVTLEGADAAGIEGAVKWLTAALGDDVIDVVRDERTLRDA